MIRRRVPVLVGFLGPGHKRHAFYLVKRPGHTVHVPACNRSTDGVIINHTEPFDGEKFRNDAIGCAGCKRMMERVTNGVTPDHLAGIE